MILNRGARLYLGEFKALAALLEDIYTSQNIFRLEGSLKDRRTGLFFQQTLGVLHGSLCSVTVRDEHPTRILGAGHIVDVMAYRETLFDVGAMFNEIGPTHLQP